MSKEPTSLMKIYNKESLAAYIKNICIENSNPMRLNEILDTYLDPGKPINDDECINTLKCLMAGGPDFGVFAKKVKEFDSSVMCGLVWNVNFVAYRCRTCAISPCMSLCADCFQYGNHDGHDFNMFRSQAGGACDCGDVNVLRANGFCHRHGSDNQHSASLPPPELLAVSQALIPRILMRFIFYFRDTSDQDPANYRLNISEAKQYISLLQSLSDMGTPMRTIVVQVLLDTELYQQLQSDSSSDYYLHLRHRFEDAFYFLDHCGHSMHVELFNEEGFHSAAQYTNMLEELVFWMIYTDFPQNMVTLLLSFLPDELYKGAFCEAFVRHYSKVVRVLSTGVDRPTVANRVVHISVQLFNNAVQASKMVLERRLLTSIVGGLSYLLTPVLAPSAMFGGPLNRHMVVECEKMLMKERSYWPVVSDLINLLCNKEISLYFLQQHHLCLSWLDVMSFLQGMNLNIREEDQHVEFEPDAYYTAFSAELEMAASPMWSLISHCRDSDSGQHVLGMTEAAFHCLKRWLEAIDFKVSFEIVSQQMMSDEDSGMVEELQLPDNQVTFHIPLHRYLAAFLNIALKLNDLSICDVITDIDVLSQIMMHPLQIQVCIPQIYSRMWVRNGIQIKGQAMTYTQCHFCYSMSDLDIFLLQVCATVMDPDKFLEIVLDRFLLVNWLSFERRASAAQTAEPSDDITMLDGCLGFLCALFGVRTYLGLSEEERLRKEMSALLCMSDRQHSQLSDLIPEHSGMSNLNMDLFERILQQLAEYKAPNFESGVGLNEGSYMPKGELWEVDFDPVMVAQRAIYKKDFQASMDRYTAHVTSARTYEGDRKALWPPFRVPDQVDVAYRNLPAILNCSTMHAFLYTVLFKVINECPGVIESVMYKSVHLLNLCLHYSSSACVREVPDNCGSVTDRELKSWFQSSDIKVNACHVITAVSVASSIQSEVEGFTNFSFEDVFSEQASSQPGDRGPIAAANLGRFPSVLMPAGSAMPGTPYEVVKEALSLPVASLHPLGESIVSLVVRLNAKLSTSTQYTPRGMNRTTEKIAGDGAFYTACFLDRLSSVGGACVEACIKKACSMCQDSQLPSCGDGFQNVNQRSGQIGRQKAFDRQQKLMAKFADEQKAFLANAEGAVDATDEDNIDRAVDMEDVCRAQSRKFYDCIICNQATPSTPTNPICLCVFLQSSSLLAHASGTDEAIPVLCGGSADFLSVPTLGSIMRRRHTHMLQLFDEASCAYSVNVGWDGGLFVSTCGHHVHFDCSMQYLDTLRQSSDESIATAHGEFHCPACRQISNSILPRLASEEGFSVVRPIPADPVACASCVAAMMCQMPREAEMPMLMQAMGRFVASAHSIAFRWLEQSFSYTHHGNSTSVFISSVARSNLEAEILLRGGKLEECPAAASVKQNCLSPLLQILGLHMKINACPPTVLRATWSRVTGLPFDGERVVTSLPSCQRSVPVLLQDLTAYFIATFLLLPDDVPLEYCRCVVRRVYCALVIQALTVLSRQMGPDERDAWCLKGAEAPTNSLAQLLRVVITELRSAELYQCLEQPGTDSAICQTVWSPHSIEAFVQKYSLPFLRVVALVQHHKYGIELVKNTLEFESLVAYLDLSEHCLSRSSQLSNSVVSGCLHWVVPQPDILVRDWCRDVAMLAKDKSVECKILLDIDGKWFRPKLRALPHNYYDIFRSYRSVQCANCLSVPKDPAVCLLCGAFVCFRDSCCVDEAGVYEVASHSVACGGGTGILLLVNSSSVVIVRGPRATVWGSVYLDQHGEEDRHLKRGKPLFLSLERLQLLERMWLERSFEKNCKQWIWHKNRI